LALLEQDGLQNNTLKLLKDTLKQQWLGWLGVHGNQQKRKKNPGI